MPFGRLVLKAGESDAEGRGGERGGGGNESRGVDCTRK